MKKNKMTKSELNDHLKNCDWDSAATLDGKTKKVVWQQALALCFRDSKDHREGKLDDAVDAATKAVASTDGANEKITARCVRAYAYYLNGNYEQAIAECKRISDFEQKEKKMDEIDTAFTQAGRFVLELLALVYGKLDEPLKANEFCRRLFAGQFTPSESECFPVSPLVMDMYRESLKRMNRR